MLTTDQLVANRDGVARMIAALKQQEQALRAEIVKMGGALGALDKLVEASAAHDSESAASTDKTANEAPAVSAATSSD